VSDTGIGINSDKLDSIFNIFQQVDHETKLKYGGTGLGLNIVKKLVAMYNGSVRAESKLNAGTTIIFNLNLKEISELKPEPKAIQYEIISKSRLLVVEDNEINQYYLSGILNKWSIEHDIANNGFEALEAMEKNQYNLILMDIRMPRMDGYETTIKLRAMKKNQNSEVPVIALTASALVDEKIKALEAGMNFHLTKPYTSSDLGKILSKFGIIKELEKEQKVTYQFSPELDLKYLVNLYQNDTERAFVMFQIFNKVIDAEFEKLKKFLFDEKWIELASVAHKIKPNFAMVGLSDLSNKMEYYEQVKVNNEIQKELKFNFPKLEAEFKDGKLIIASELERMNKMMKE
jgi:CheY-like chemotaxis protein